MTATSRSATGLLLGAVLIGTLVRPPSVAIGAEEVEVVTLPGGTVLARVADLDRDGVREVVRIVSGVGRGPLEVEAWRHERGSDWHTSNRVALVTPLPGGQIAALADQAALLPWSDGTAERLLVLAGRGSTPFGVVSDLSVWKVSLDGMRLSLEPMPGGEGPARRIDAADLDGDGVDELVVTEGGTRVDPSAGLRVLRWAGDRFVAEPIDIGEGRYPTEPIVGDSDGEGGADIVIGLHTGTDLYRVTSDGSELEVEHAALGAAGALERAWPIAAAQQAIYLFGDSPSGPRVARLEWSRGNHPVVTASTAGRTFGWLHPMEREGSVVFIDDPGFGRIGDGGEADAVVRDAGLEVVATVGPSSAATRARGWAASAEGLVTGFFGPFPYSGPMPGGVDGSPAYVRSGQLLTFEEDGLRTRPTATLIGMAPLGLAGVNEAWLVLGRGIWADGSGTYLQAMAPIDDATWLVQADAALRPEAEGGELPFELRGGTMVEDGAGSWVASADGGFEVAVRGMPGARVGAVIGGRLLAQAEVGADGTAVLELDPRPRRQDTVEYRATIVLLEPTGHAYSTAWEGRVIREAPGLDVSGETVGGSFEAGLVGRVGPGSAVTVDGTPVAIDGEGRFATTVDAGLVPREIVVRAVDPIGQEVVRRVQVVGLVDYRGWPWPVVLGAMVVLAGAGMYLRAPRQRARAAARDDGVIEELDAG